MFGKTNEVCFNSDHLQKSNGLNAMVKYVDQTERTKYLTNKITDANYK